ncbi:cytochrome c oxidase assembly protein [Neobacillus rhizosphaerae]|uniref:cytochrome c oxidase assembly protein n=1 Tax=Neobacillus rhizosphaerae TaxID=2880965 RepID=UPI003872E66E
MVYSYNSSCYPRGHFIYDIQKRYSELTLLHKQPLLFLLSLALLILTTGSPLATLSHLSFSLHMIQMSILFFIIPPLLLLGTPELVFQRFVKIPLIHNMKILCYRPLISLCIFAILFFMYHIPFILTIFSENPTIHNGYLLLLFFLSFSIWRPIVKPISNIRVLNKQKTRCCPKRNPSYARLFTYHITGTNNWRE